MAAPRAAKSLLLPARSVPEKLEFAWEPFSAVIEEAMPLLRRHYAELQLDEPFNPDWQSLFFLERTGRLRIATARNSDGRLVGYCGGLLINYLVCQDAKAVMVNAIYIEETYRGYISNVATFLRMMANFAKRMNANFLEMGPQGQHSAAIGRMLIKMGWEPSPEPAWRLKV